MCLRLVLKMRWVMVRKVISLIENIITIVLLASVVVLLFFLIKSKTAPNQIPSVAGYRLMGVLSGSMRPLLEPGDMILIKPVNLQNIREGDVITYQTNQGNFVTHRIVNIYKKNEGLMFKTKGDANNVDDEILVSQNQLVGSMAFRIPYGGYIARFIRTPFGFAILVFLAVSIIAADEIKRIISKPKEKFQKTESSK